MNSNNSITLVGLVSDIDSSITDHSGKRVYRIAFTVAGNDPKGFFQRVTFLGPVAEKLMSSLKEGQLVKVTGKLEENVYEKEGKKVSRLQIRGEKVQPLAGTFELVGETSNRMAKGRNFVMLEGTLGKDVEVGSTEKGQYANFSVAISDDWKDKNGNWVKVTHWVRIVAYDEVVEQVKNLKKGDLVSLEGQLVDDSYTDKEGAKVKNNKVVISRADPLERATKKETRELVGVGVSDGQNQLPPEDDDLLF